MNQEKLYKSRKKKIFKIIIFEFQNEDSFNTLFYNILIDNAIFYLVLSLINIQIYLFFF